MDITFMNINLSYFVITISSQLRMKQIIRGFSKAAVTYVQLVNSD